MGENPTAHMPRPWTIIDIHPMPDYNPGRFAAEPPVKHEEMHNGPTETS